MTKRFAAGLGALFLAAAVLAGCGTSDNQRQGRNGTYYINAEGEASGWLERDGAYYYLDDSGRSLTGWQQLDGETFYFRDDGTMATGWLELEGSRYYLRSDGTRVTGWLSIDGTKYYLDDSGAVATGVLESDGTVYLFGSDGLLARGWAEVNGKRYYGDANGHPVSGWQEIDGTGYYFGADYAAHTGWLELDGLTYYFNADGTPARGAVTIGDNTHHFAFNGQEIILVNPWNEMPEDYAPELVSIGGDHRIAEIAYADYQDMMAACRAAGMDPAVCSAYRTVAYQEMLFEKKVEYYTDLGYGEEEAASLAGTSVAVPGTSEHHLGLALDIVDNRNWSLNESQAKMPTQQWLMNNSWRYGWILRYPTGKSEITGIIYEPWHYRYVGREVAADIHESGLCLEEYLDMLTEK